VLENPRREDMFWWSYEVLTLPNVARDVFSQEFWVDTIEVEDMSTGVRISGVYAGKILPKIQHDRVWLRGFIPYPLNQ